MSEYTAWEVTIIELRDDRSRRYKVTRRLPALTVAETKFFETKKNALRQFNKWLQ